MAANLHVGCSGWSYRDWRGTFYDAKLPARTWFSQYSSRFRTVEINNTFYRMPPAATFESWACQAPAGFVFSLKLNRFGTHRLKLGQPERWVGLHVQRAALLGRALGPNLVQLPPNWHRDLGRLEAFLAMATEVGAATSVGTPLEWAVEFRDPSWLTGPTFEVLARYQAALCCHDLLEGHPWELTAPWAYVRFHGPEALTKKYVGDYGDTALARPAADVRAWLSGGHDVFAYFNNDTGGAAPRDALRLERLVKSG